MTQLNNPVYLRLFEKYNEVLADAYNTALDNPDLQNEDSQAEFAEAIRNSVYNSVQGWASLPLSAEESALTGEKIIDGLAGLEDAVELAKYAAVLCDDGLPDQIRIKLGSFGAPAQDELLSFILETDWESPADPQAEADQDQIIAASFLKLLGDWNCTDSRELIIAKFCARQNPSEAVAESVRYFLVQDGAAAVPSLTGCLGGMLHGSANLNAAGEYLLIALTDIGKDHREDQIFTCLRSCFRQMANKAIGAICLGDYGDGRGVATLKGWLDSHPAENDPQTISEILSSIKRLGGDVSDVSYRLKLPR